MGQRRQVLRRWPRLGGVVSGRARAGRGLPGFQQGQGRMVRSVGKTKVGRGRGRAPLS